jgi:uncharacterized protein YndB with AHSA1/START domain
MMHDLSVVKNISINADKEKVWGALTDPRIIQQYLYGAETVTDWKAGSPIIFQGEVEGQKWQDKGVILENQPGEVLRYSYWSGFCGLEDIPENYSTVTYRLESRGSDTLLTISQEGYPGEESQQSSGNNWNGILQKIKELVENS